MSQFAATNTSFQESPLKPFQAFSSEILKAPLLLRKRITENYRTNEIEAVRFLLEGFDETVRNNFTIRELAKRLVIEVRKQRTRSSGVDALMQEFSLSSEEGVALMCLAEALLRIPDKKTADRLIADKIGGGNWKKHLGESPSLFVNAAAWGLLVTGKLVSTNSEGGLTKALSRLIAKGGEPLIRKGVDLAMRMLGNQFVTGQTISEALENSRKNEARGYLYSYDMLGEAALTEEDAQRYLLSYQDAIHHIGKASNGRGIKKGPGISVKLSALHPRYSRAQRNRVMGELLPRLKQLILLAKQYNIGLNIDAEEADRLELSLDLMEELAFDPELEGYEGIGFVVQAYQKRCPFVIDYLVDLARRSQRKFMVRLVKGAYWDSEIKRAQVEGMEDYPVYTRKVYTDLSYLHCARKLLKAADVIYPQFATHNAYTLSTVYTWAKEQKIENYEFQCLFGMGETLYDQVVGKSNLDKPCRIYAPVGSHDTLLAYLVRRLLENGANSSFVNQIVDEDIPIDSLIENPIEVSEKLEGQPHPAIPLPINLYGSERQNSRGLDLSNENILRALTDELEVWGSRTWNAGPLLAINPTQRGNIKNVLNPSDNRDLIGQVIGTDLADVELALAAAASYTETWAAVSPRNRAEILCRAANLFEKHLIELMSLTIREGGKTLPNAIGEIREAVDFLRYYSAQIVSDPVAEPLGPVVCISPWNFPLAIFIGEVSASLAAGNPVLAKSADQTTLIAHRAVELLHEAGVPRAALQFVPGRGSVVGTKLIGDSRVKAVIFTGSTEVGQILNRTLANRMAVENQDLVLVAETGGQNAMIVDSSALPEQVVQDVITSAFDSAGQRCSALRVLCLQQDIADRTLEMLQGAMSELRIGNPDRLSTDIGPVIDKPSQKVLLDHIEKMKPIAKRFYQIPLGEDCSFGNFVPPTLIEIDSIDQLEKEVFGPVLHVVRYRQDRLAELIKAINATGFGLTLGVHSRIDETIDFVASHAHVGNIYANRNIVGAVVGVQPFGGEGKSGTGPKAGGPLYIKRLQKTSSNIARKTEIELPSLKELQNWILKHSDHANHIRICHTYLSSTLLSQTVNLPGPTGESNTLSFVPRGAVLCAAISVSGLLNQLAATYATGNTPVIFKETSHILPVDFPKILRDKIRVIDTKELGKSEIHVALTQGEWTNKLRLTFAELDGPIVHVIETEDHELIPLWRLLAERALCVNTAAAGGNASLMTLRG